MIGGFTTNLLTCVFETWLDSEFCKQQLEAVGRKPDQDVLKLYQQEYELLMRDAVIVSNAAAIGSGYLSHVHSEWY